MTNRMYDIKVNILTYEVKTELNILNYDSHNYEVR